MVDADRRQWAAGPTVEEIRRHWPFLRDRRVDAYAPLLKRWLDK